ncbi:hypothetical protein J2Y03_000570 [Neobacillus niacini]|nr:hypothetical protein [Neobacillus niacini]
MNLKNEDLLSKKAITNDLALIKSCLKLINSSIKVNRNNGGNFSVVSNKELHNLVSSVDVALNKIKKNINWGTENESN